jgi:hypothetical protein
VNVRIVFGRKLEFAFQRSHGSNRSQHRKWAEQGATKLAVAGQTGSKPQRSGREARSAARWVQGQFLARVATHLAHHPPQPAAPATLPSLKQTASSAHLWEHAGAALHPPADQHLSKRRGPPRLGCIVELRGSPSTPAAALHQARRRCQRREDLPVRALPLWARLIYHQAVKRD